MANVTALPNRRVVEQEAADWLVKLDSDTRLDGQQRDELQQWINRSAAHRQELKQLNQFWSNNILTELVVPLGKVHTSNHWTQRFQAPWLTALAALLLLSVSLWIPSWLSDDFSASNGVYLTAVGQNKTITLIDGSIVQLNTNSQIQVEYDAKYRNIRLLQGQAYFEVAKDAQHPFRVYAGDGRVEAIGTAFSVYIQNGDVNVVVTEGKVAVAALTAIHNNNQGVIDSYAKSRSRSIGTLSAGQAITVKTDDYLLQAQQAITQTIEALSEEEIARQQAWRHGMLVFAGESLEEVVAQISRYTTISIEITDPELKHIQIGGRFKVGEIDDMLTALQANFGLQVTRLSFNHVQLSAPAETKNP